MINVIRKQSISDTSKSIISNTDIEALVHKETVILLEPVKESINLTYDALGYADKTLINLGTQYDHRVTWLHFDLDKLIWNLDAKRNYTEDTKYHHYTFKLAFSKSGAEADNMSVWEFDGIDFEVPRGITKEAGLYKIVLIIEEYIRDEEVSNVDTRVERFVAAEIKGKVSPSIYHPDETIEINFEETNQKEALVKPKIECTLTDDGHFSSDVIELGQKYDNYIRYFKFNPRRITAHLNDFYVFAIFRQGDLFYSSMFEHTWPDDPLDDYSASHPIIAWVPNEVYQHSGTWQVAIIAFFGNMDDLNNNDDNGDYYFYVSHATKMKIMKNSLTKDIVEKEPILSITGNFITEIGEIIITADDKIYQAAKETEFPAGLVDSSGEVIVTSDNEIYQVNN